MAGSRRGKGRNKRKGSRGGSRGASGGADRRDPAAANRTARVGELIRRIVAEELESVDDERLDMVSITSVDVDRELHRAVVWFTCLESDDDPEVTEAFGEHRGRLRKAVSSQARLRHTPELDFRSDMVLRSAERIEDLVREAPRLDEDDDEPGDGEEI